MSEPLRHYPGPVSAVFITLGALTVWAFVIALFGPEPDLGVVGIGQAAGLGLVATLVARSVPAPQQERLGLCGFSPSLLPTLLLLVPVLVLVGDLDHLIRGFIPAQPGAGAPAAGSEPWLQPVHIDRSINAIQTTIVVVGLAPVVEEWLFRGVLQQGVVAYLGRVRGVLLTSVLFAMVNVAPTTGAGSPLSLLAGSVMLGVVYGVVRLGTGSLLAPILLHAAVNGLGLWWVSAQALSVADGPAGLARAPVVVSIAALMAVGLGTHGMWKAAQAREATLPLQRGAQGDLPWRDV